MLKVLEAQKELEKGVCLCPGLWEQHSKSVAHNAMLIAEQTKTMDKEQAYVMGLMHDIGRREGIKGIQHIFDGYNYNAHRARRISAYLLNTFFSN